MGRSRYGFARLFVVCGVLASMLSAAETSPEGGKAASAAKPLRMLTFNIYSDWRAPSWGVPSRAPGVERAIVKAQPDIVALLI